MTSRPTPSAVALGIDIGGSKLLACAVDRHGSEARPPVRCDTGRVTGPAAVVERIVQVARDVAQSGGHVVAVGIGFPGLVDASRGIARSSVMLDGWRDVPLAMEVARALGVPCVIDNDVRMAAANELAVREDRADPAVSGCVVFLGVGTGIGGAVAFGGRLWRGATGVAGEIGNTTIDFRGGRCWCGRNGCLNTNASGTAIERAAGLASGTLAAAWERQVPGLGDAVTDAARCLGHGIANVVQILNPDLVVLGGGVAELGPTWLAEVERVVRAQAFPEATERLRLEVAVGGYASGALGAGRLAWAAAGDSFEPNREAA